jgi:hypothetical protein
MKGTWEIEKSPPGRPGGSEGVVRAQFARLYDGIGVTGTTPASPEA